MSVAAVVAETRAEAEDAADMVMVDWEELPAVMGILEALDPDSPPIHPDLGDNLCFQHTVDTGDAASGLSKAAFTVTHEFEFGRHTAVTLEGRALIAHWDRVEERLTVHHSHQSPYQMQDVFSRHLNIPEHKVRVITPDIGGGFGLKINVHGEELLARLADARALGDEAEDVELDVRRVGEDGDVRPLRARLGVGRPRRQVLLHPRHRHRAGGLEHRARVLEAVAHRRADLAGRHRHDVVDELVADAEDLVAQTRHVEPINPHHL